MKETELAAHVVEWLTDQHWDVYQEVRQYQGGPIADIVAVRHGIVWVIECKLSAGLYVLEQAGGWHSHLRSVAVPESRSRTRRFEFVARDYFKVGVIEVNKRSGNVNEVRAAPLMREYHKLATDLRSILHDGHKEFSEAGSKDGGYWTPYKETMRKVRRVIEGNPGCTIGEIYKRLEETHYRNEASAKSGIRNSLVQFESDWCRVDTDTKPFRFYIRKDAE